MKDAYSFDVDQEGLEKEYKNMWEAYTRIFKRCGLDTKAVQSDSGAIGGSVSHEFMVITTTDAGENDVFYCDGCEERVCELTGEYFPNKKGCELWEGIRCQN